MDAIVDNSTGNFFFDVSRRRVTTMQTVFIFGHNPDTDTGTEEDIWEVGGTIVYLTAAETMDIVSSDAADTSVGTGARTIRVDGLDDDFLEVNETITLNGTTPVTTTQAFRRINNLVVITAGSGGTNAGTITATASTAATIQNQVNPGNSVSRGSHFTVPAAKTLYLLHAEFNAAKISGGGTPVPRFIGLARKNDVTDSPFFHFFDKSLDTGVQVEIDLNLPIYPRFTEKTDIKFRSNTDVNNTEVQSRLYAVLEDD